jgi:hypothetical protein
MSADRIAAVVRVLLGKEAVPVLVALAGAYHVGGAIGSTIHLSAFRVAAPVVGIEMVVLDPQEPKSVS